MAIAPSSPALILSNARLLMASPDLPRSRRVTVDEYLGELRQHVTLAPSQVRPLAFAEYRQQENRKFCSAIERDHPITAALALAAPGEANLARAAGAGNHVACIRASRKVVDNPADIAASQPSRLGGRDEGRRLDDHVHACCIRQRRTKNQARLIRAQSTARLVDPVCS